MRYHRYLACNAKHADGIVSWLGAEDRQTVMKGEFLVQNMSVTGALLSCRAVFVIDTALWILHSSTLRKFWLLPSNEDSKFTSKSYRCGFLLPQKSAIRTGGPNEGVAGWFSFTSKYSKG